MSQRAAQKDDYSSEDRQLPGILQLQTIERLLDDMETAAALLHIGETVLEIWIRAHQRLPTSASKEGFRLLALHRQGSRGEPSFNACRETCRELVYYYNLIVAEPAHAHVADR